MLDSSSSCIDLIFTSQANLALESDVQLSLNTNCHYQLVFAKFDLIRSHFVDADVIYDQSYKSSFHEKLELIQYNAALPVTRAIRGSPSEKVYQELGLDSLQRRRWFRKLCQF